VQEISSIFDWIMLSSLMGGILVILILAVKIVFKNTLSANWHYYIWLLLLLRLVIPFSAESPVSMYNFVNLNSLENAYNSNFNSFTELNNLSMETGGSPSKLVNHNIPLIISSSKINRDFTVKSAPTDFETINWKAALILFWLIGVALLVGYTVVINLKIWYQIRTGPKTNNVSITHLVETCKSEMKITNNIPVVITSKINTPALFGPIKPWLLIPNTLINNLSETELKYIVLHELSHWKRKDILINWITVLLQIIHWFNPLIWYGFYRMHQDCELACDAQVLSSLDLEKHKEYGRTIIRVLEMMLSQKWIPGTTRMLSNKSNIKRRIYMISKFKKESHLARIVTVILFMAVGIIGCTSATDNNTAKAMDKNTYNQMLAGTVDIKGPGVVVTLSDSDSPKYDQASLVHDADIIRVVNQLQFAGAEAISINGERLIATSSIYVAGTSILINGNLYSSPFVIKAIGDSNMMSTNLQLKGGIAELLREYGIKITIKESRNLSIPKFKGEVNFKYAKPVEN